MGAINFCTEHQQASLAAVAALVTQYGGATQDDVARLLGLARPSALPYLHALRDEGLIHRRMHSKVWVPGPADDWAGMPDGPLVRQSSAPRSGGGARRDPLVEALFGPPA